MYVCVWVFRDTQKNCRRIEEYKKKKRVNKEEGKQEREQKKKKAG